MQESTSTRSHPQSSQEPMRRRRKRHIPEPPAPYERTPGEIFMHRFIRNHIIMVGGFAIASVIIFVWLTFAMNNHDLQQMRDTLHHNSGYIEDRPNGKIVYEDQVQVPARVKPTRKPSVGGGMRELPAATPQAPVATPPVVQPALQFPGEGRG